jgi:flagellin
MAFNGNDSYGFTLTVGDGASGTDALTIAGATVSAGSASDVATKINAAIANAVTANTMTSGAAVAAANGNVVTITNALGDSIDVSAFTSASNGTASYASVTGAGTSKLLNDAAAVVALSNSGGGAATAATGTLTLQTGKDYSFTVNGTNINVTNLGTTTTEAALLAELKTAIGAGSAASSVNGQAFSLADSSGKEIAITNFQSTSAAAGSAGSMALTVRVDADNNTPSNTFAVGGSDTTDVDGTDIVQLSFSEAEADYGFKIDTVAFTVATASASKTLAEALAITRDAINADATISAIATARVVDGKLEIENTQAAGTAITIDTFTSTGKAAVVAGTATLGSTNLVTAQQASTNTGTEATVSETTMSFSQDDEYSFKIGGTLVTASISGSDLGAMVSAVNAQSSTTGVSGSVSNGDLLLTNAAGGAIAITEFASAGTGIATAATAAGQGGSATLSDTAAVTGAATAAAGTSTASTMALSMDATDNVTFQLSDGKTNAVVRLTSFSITDNAAMLAEIQSALTNAGSDITAAVSSGTSPITLTNAAGGKIDLTKFTSDGSGVLTASPGSEQGVGKILDDTGTSASQSAVAAIDIKSSAGATTAIATIDRALEQINAQRAELGAISNRLDHTISNLGNVVINTEASQSRIQDADFAKVTGDLTKSQIMSQAATAMLAQANASKQGVLSLLQG